MQTTIKVMFFTIAILAFSIFTVHGQNEIMVSVNTTITITRSGELDDTGDILEDLITSYLSQALDANSQTQGYVPALEIIIHADNKNWSEMTFGQGSEINDADQFTITVSATPSASVEISGATALATGFGVIRFLEDYAGISWLFPGALGTVIPVQDNILLSVGTESYKPAFQSRMLSGLIYRANDLPPEVLALRGTAYLHRGFFWASDYCRSLGLHSLTQTNHNMKNIFPNTETAQNYPELFPMVNGQRPVRTNYFWHPCYTNPLAASVAATKALDAFQNEFTQSFSLGINDGLKVRCECSACTAAGWPEAYYGFVNAVANQLSTYYKPHELSVLCYSDVIEPPVSAMPENVSMTLTRIPQRDYAPWLAKAQHVGLYQYFYGMNYLVPNLPWDSISDNAAIMNQGEFRSYYAEIYPLWAFDAPKIYVLKNLLWDPSQSVGQLLNDYCVKAFGAAATPMRQFYEQWQFLGGQIDPDGFSRTWNSWAWRNSTGQFSLVPPSTIAACDSFISAAQAATSDSDVLARIAMINTFYQHVKALWQTYQGMNEVSTAPYTGNSTQALSDLLDANAAKEDRLSDMALHPEWFEYSSYTSQYITSESIISSGRWSLDAEWLYAVLTCLWRLDGNTGALTLPPGVPNLFGNTLLDSSAVTTHVRSYLPLDSGDEPLVAMNCSKAGSTLVFSTIEEDFTWQYMSAIAKDIPLNETTFHRHNLSLTGKDGEAIIEVLLIANGITRRVASLVNRFDEQQNTQQREFVIQPAWLQTGTRRLSRDYSPGALCQYKLNITWKPDSADAALSGTWNITGLTYDE